MSVVDIPTKFCSPFCYLLIASKWREKKNQHQESHQRETMHDKFAIFAKLGIGKAKKSIG